MRSGLTSSSRASRPGDLVGSSLTSLVAAADSLVFSSAQNLTRLFTFRAHLFLILAIISTLLFRTRLDVPDRCSVLPGLRRRRTGRAGN